jgi:hypothetical protein
VGNKRQQGRLHKRSTCFLGGLNGVLVGCLIPARSHLVASVHAAEAVAAMAGSASATSHAETSAHLYDAVGQIWLELFGEHVHVGRHSLGLDRRGRGQVCRSNCTVPIRIHKILFLAFLRVNLRLKATYFCRVLPRGLA